MLPAGNPWRDARVVLCTMAALLLPSGMQAQRPLGEISIEVKDPSGAAMEASGRLQSLPAGVNRTFRTDASGRYTFAGLPYGRYRLEVSKGGFATQTMSIDLRSQRAARTVTMPLTAPSFKVDVVGVAPLPGVDRALNEIPAPVQVATQQDAEQSGAMDLSGLLNRRLNGVYLNEIQQNPFQPDLSYRGYTASPLLGSAEGISIYMDGVRMNQPFGDIVSWDLIPRAAISEVALIPGSNPLFGLNTLGGALSIQTKDGHGNPGFQIQAGAGAYGRRAVELEYGHANSKGLNWYITGNLLHTDGWRDDSGSDVRQVFSKLGWQNTRTALGFAFAYAGNVLFGNGLQEPRFLARDYSSVYTKPDRTDNRSPFFNFSARHSAGASLTFSGNAYYRYIRTDTFNGDVNENSLDQQLYQPSAADIRALTAAGYAGFPTSGATAANTPFPFWRCIAQVLQRDEPAEKCNGVLNRTYTRQHNYGVAGQLTWLRSPRFGRNQFTAGTAYDNSSVDFQQSTELGYLNPDRSVTGVNAFADGVTGGTVDGEPYDTRVDLHGRPRTWSLFATDTLSIGNAWNITLSGRYNRTSIDNRDRIRPGGVTGSLDGQNVFERFNPAAGVTVSPTRRVNMYASLSEGSRAPTSIELGCADPNQPCKLPNALAGDPPLRQVVTRTWEAGLRGGPETKWNWNAGWFRAENRNDVLFVASTQTGFGYFKNFGKTRRQGLEAGVSGRIRRVSLGGGYTFLDATYQSPEIVNGSANSVNSAVAKGLDGTIQIGAGDRIPLVPRHMLKAFADFEATRRLSLDLGLIALSSSYARGNENNQHRADGTYYLGPGTSPGYAVVNLGGRYQVHRRVQMFAEVDNLFDRRYYTAAQLGPTAFTDQGTFIARPFSSVGGEFPIQHATFYAPGAPIAISGGLRLKF